jgi:hypothetical protein
LNIGIKFPENTILCGNRNHDSCPLSLLQGFDQGNQLLSLVLARKPTNYRRNLNPFGFNSNNSTVFFVIMDECPAVSAVGKSSFYV